MSTNEQPQAKEKRGSSLPTGLLLAAFGALVGVLGTQYFASAKEPVLTTQEHIPDLEFLPDNILSQIDVIRSRLEISHSGGSTARDVSILVEVAGPLKSANAVTITIPPSAVDAQPVDDPVQIGNNVVHRIDVEQVRPGTHFEVLVDHPRNSPVRFEAYVGTGSIKTAPEVSKQTDGVSGLLGVFMTLGVLMACITSVLRLTEVREPLNAAEVVALGLSGISLIFFLFMIYSGE